MDRISSSFKISRLTIGQKILGSFLVLIVIVAGTGIALRNAIGTFDTVNSDLAPTVNTLTKFSKIIQDSRTYTTNWVYVGSYETDKKKLQEIHQQSYPAIKDEIEELSKTIVEGDMDSTLNALLAKSDELIASQKSVMQSLQRFEDYEDAMIRFVAEDQIETNIIPNSDFITSELQKIIDDYQQRLSDMNEEMVSNFERLNVVILTSGILSVIFALTISFFLSRAITVPLNKVLDRISNLSQGKIPDPVHIKSRDEMSQIGDGINKLIEGFNTTSVFAEKIMAGDLEADYKLLSEEDMLGTALIAMRDNLKGVIEETNNVARRVSEEGILDSRLDLVNKQGAWSELAFSTNALLDSISQPIKRIDMILLSMAKGDLTQRYKEEAKGEILRLTQSLNNALDNLANLLGEISVTAMDIEESTAEMLVSGEEMSQTTTEIASATSQMSNGAHTQVAKVDESSNLIETILSSSKDMGNKSEVINSAAKKGVDDSKRGADMLQNVTRSITTIAEYSDSTNESMKELQKRSEQIGKILSVITEIAAQTNLLALNAAIEAAQAGEAGRGFAVVAEEIRKLAESSRSSAKEIATLVEGVRTDTERTAGVISKMTEVVRDGVTASQEASFVFQEISSSSQQTLDHSKEILHSTKEQSLKINEVVTITESIVVIAEQTSSGTSEVASSATELSSGMDTYLEKFKNMNGSAIKLKDGLSQFKLKNA